MPPKAEKHILSCTRAWSWREFGVSYLKGEPGLGGTDGCAGARWPLATALGNHIRVATAPLLFRRSAVNALMLHLGPGPSIPQLPVTNSAPLGAELMGFFRAYKAPFLLREHRGSAPWFPSASAPPARAQCPKGCKESEVAPRNLGSPNRSSQGCKISQLPLLAFLALSWAQVNHRREKILSLMVSNSQ